MIQRKGRKASRRSLALGALVLLAFPANASASRCEDIIKDFYIKRGSLSPLKSVSSEFGCESQAKCIVDLHLRAVANDTGLPLKLLRAVAWTESTWTHWVRARNGEISQPARTMGSRTADFGLMQVNQAWKAKAHRMPYSWYEVLREKNPSNAWSLVVKDMLGNGRFGAMILRDAYQYARSAGYKGDSAILSAYAVYNGGPRAVRRPFNTRHPHDLNFRRHLNNQAWSSDADFQRCPK